MTQRMTSLAAAWQSTKIVRTREKITFFLGVMSLLFTALMLGMTPQYVLGSIPHVIITSLTFVLDTSTFRTPSRHSTFCLYALTTTRNVHGTTSSSTCATFAPSSTSSTSGLCLIARHYSLHVTVCHMARWQVL